MSNIKVSSYYNLSLERKKMRSSGSKLKLTTCPVSHVQGLQFSVISDQIIDGISVAEITEPKIMQYGIPFKGGPNDLRLGISSSEDTCQTCQEKAECQGHFGHIKLQEPIFHYGFLRQIQKILKSICHNCFKVKRPKDLQQQKKFIQITRLESNKDRLNLLSKLLESLSICYQSNSEELHNNYEILNNFKGCGWKQNPKKIILKSYQLFTEQSIKKKGKILKPISRSYVRNILQRLSMYPHECQILGFNVTKPIDLMMKKVIVAPPQIRPPIQMRSQIRCDDDITKTYCKIITLNQKLIKDKIKFTGNQREQIIEDIEHLVASIMFKLNMSVINRNRTKNLKKKKRIQNFKTISDRLQGKQGRFRQNLMGKRVDFSARTVISPDPNLQLDQLGVPIKIARKLTYPEQVNQLNYEKIINLCLEGKVNTLIRPPQQCLRNQNRVINMLKLLGQPREQIQKYVNYGMIAERTLENGDYVLLNRQPTLHRMSMMSHRVKILPFNTFRLNLSVCTPYNADFDGDQMNIHVPQSYESLAELKKISVVQKQIVAPKNSTPIMGIVQDALLGVYLFTLRDTFLKKQEIMNLLMWVKVSENQQECEQVILNLPLPAILLPEELWTGKQLMSIIIPKNYTTKHIKQKSEGLSNLPDTNLYIKNGKILTGCLQKDMLGFGAGSLIHSIWLQSGASTAKNFLTNTQRVINNWMLQNSFTVGASDIAPSQQLKSQIIKQKSNINSMYYKIHAKYTDSEKVQRENLHQRGKKIENSFEFNINMHLNNRLTKAQDIIRANLFNTSSRNISTIVEAKSKGSETNLAQILFSVGNQNVNGKRCPLGFSRRALPHFCKYDNSPESRGYVYSSFYQGLKPHELFFHSMGGREGLSDTAVKTSHVGYLQRKLVKALQDIIVHYDGTVRDSHDNLLQKSYGQDGFLPQYLQKHRIIGAELGKQGFRKRYRWQDKQLKNTFNYSQQKIDKLKLEYSTLYYYRKRLRKIFIENNQSNSIEYYCPIRIQRIINKIANPTAKQNIRYNQQQYESIGPVEIYEQVEKLIEECVPPITSQVDCFFKSKIATQILDDYDSMSQQSGTEQSFSQSFNTTLRNTSLLVKFLKKQVNLSTNKTNFIKSKHTNSLEQELGLQMFRIHLRFNLSSRNLIKKFKISRSCFQNLLKQVKKKFHQALAPAGESVGAIAAQSIGEPTTQMTLNTFHLAGVSDKNVTLGLPRLQQLLDISTNIKTPSMTIFPRKKIIHSERTKSENQSYLLDHLTYLLPQRKVSDFLNSTKIIYHPINQHQEKGTNQDDTFWGLVLVFNWRKFSSKKYWLQIIFQIQNFVKKNAKGFYKVIEKKQFNDTVEQMENPQLLIQHITTQPYILKDQNYLLETSQNQPPKKSSKIVNQCEYNKDEDEESLNCEIFHGLLELDEAIRNISVCGIKGIKSAKTAKKIVMSIPKNYPLASYSNPNDPFKMSSQLAVLETDGTNLRACLSHPEINSRKTYTNDVSEIAKVLGIEAARQAFLNELKDILSPYGIFINVRHLTILVDWICMRGKMTAVNRHGINKDRQSSIFKKASYEQTTKILLQSAVFSQKDYLRGVSERVLFGETIRAGSSIFNLMIDLEKVSDYVSKAEFDKKNIKADLNTSVFGFCDRTPDYMTPKNSAYDLNTSFQSRLSAKYTPDVSMAFSPNVSFNQSPHRNFRSPLSSPKYHETTQSLSITNLSAINHTNSSNASSPSYLLNQLTSMNSSFLSSFNITKIHQNRFSQQNSIHHQISPSPIYNSQPAKSPKKPIQKVEQNQEQDIECSDF